MKRSISVTQKTQEKKRRPGRPATGQIPNRSIRLPDELWTAIDEWRRVQPDIPTRNESIRRLLAKALGKPR